MLTEHLRWPKKMAVTVLRCFDIERGVNLKRKFIIRSAAVLVGAAILAASPMSVAGVMTTISAEAATFDYHAVFDATYYAAAYPDVVAAIGTDAELLYQHYVNSGMLEGRQPSAAFNAQIYMSNYEDLQAIYGNNIAAYVQHYILAGQAEGRVADHLLAGKSLVDFNALTTTTTTTTSTVDLSAWNLVLVNHDNPISTEYAPEVSLCADGEYMHKDVTPIVQQMIADAKAQGINLYLVSGYRSASRQTYLYNRKVKYYKNLGYSQSESERLAATVVNPPGQSEHQTGLCMDITDSSYVSLTEDQENTAGYKWVYEHCAEYGFILRYPKDKEDVTGVIYEPWHFRYVGVEAATEIMSRGITLEEYVAENSL